MTIPQDWSVTTLEKEAELIMGQSPPSEVINADGQGLPFLQGNAEFGPAYPRAQYWCTQPAKQAEKGDILISVRAPVGALNKADQDYCIGRGLAAVRFKNTQPDFGWYALQHEVNQLQRVSQGSTFEAVNREELGKLTFLRPSESEQRKIAIILSSVDETIEQTQALIAQIGRAKQALLDSITLRGLPGRHLKFREIKEIGPVAEGWEMVRLKDIAERITSGSRGWAEYYSDEGDIFLRITNLTRKSVNPDLSDIQRVSPPPSAEGTRTKVQAGDVLISITADLGVIGCIPSGFPDAYINQHIALVRLTPNTALPYWVASYLVSPTGQSQFRRLNDPGAKAGLNLESIRQLIVPLPPTEEQQSISTLLASFDVALASEVEGLKQMQTVKKGLMQALLRGKKRVVLPLIEAASA